MTRKSARAVTGDGDTDRRRHVGQIPPLGVLEIEVDAGAVQFLTGEE